MTALEVLTELRRQGVDVRAEDGRLITRPPGAVPEALRPLLVAHRDELLGLVARECPGCGIVDYLPLGGGWRRCWACGRRWGSGRDPGDPLDLGWLARVLELPAQSAPAQPLVPGPGWSIRAVLACPKCGNRVCSIPPAGRPHRRCDGPRGCGHAWNPEAAWK